MSERRTATVLMLDVVGSTHVAAELGDARYRELSSRFVRIVRAALRAFAGREEDHAGDGFFASFPEPDRAIRCAAAISDGVRSLGIEIRSGIHTGQTGSLAGKTQGIAVVIAARVMSLAGPGEILVTSTTKELVAGSRFDFEDFSAHELKGVPGTWRVFAVTGVDGRPLTGPLDASEAAAQRASIEPTSPLSRRRTAPVVLVGIAVVAAIASAALLSGNDESPSAPRRSDGAPAPESIVQVDPTTGQILAEIEAPVAQRGRPGLQRGTPDHPMVVAKGGVWSLRSYRWLYLIDPSTRSVRRVINLETPNSFSVNVAAGLDEIWVVYDQGLKELDPATQDQRGVLPLPAEDTPASSDLAIGDGYVWIVTTQGLLHRYDPRTERSREIDIGGSPDAIGFGHGSIWVGDAFDGSVTRIDASSMRREEIDLPQGVDNIVVGEDVWVLSRTLHAVTPIDPSTNTPGPSVPVGDDPTGLTAGDGYIWIGDQDGVIRRLNEATRQVTPIAFGAPIRALAFDDGTGTLWVDVAGPD